MLTDLTCRVDRLTGGFGSAMLLRILEAHDVP
ncbi:hypothetical protein ACVWZZ_000172 [Bradyrhizobium sp. LM6.10]